MPLFGKDVDYVIGHNSIAHTYGNVTLAVMDYIKKLFPPNFFKTTNIRNQIAYRGLNRRRSKEFVKNQKPSMYIEPTIDIMNQDVFMYGTLETTRITDGFKDVDFGQLAPFMKDPNRLFCCDMLTNRLSMTFGFTLAFDTAFQQLNYALYFKNMIRQGHPFNIDCLLENMIPHEIINIISIDNNIPIIDEFGSVKPFFNFIQERSMYPLTYKLKDSSGTDEFFRIYPTSIIASVQDLTVNEPEYENMVERLATIQFNVVTEFATSGLYYYFSRNKKLQEIKLSILINDDVKQIIPIFTSSVDYMDNIPEGWQIYATTMYKVSHNDQVDITDITPLFTIQTVEIIKYHIDNGISLLPFLKYRVFKDGVELDPDQYDIDIVNMKLYTRFVNMDSTYRLVIYSNLRYIHELSDRLYGYSKET